jgi:hypothetical protein
MFNEPQNMEYLEKLTQKILRSEAPGMRQATLVDAYHVVDGNDITSFVVYDKEPNLVDGALQHERRWVVVVTLQDQEVDSQSWSKTRGIVSLRWEDEEPDV